MQKATMFKTGLTVAAFLLIGTLAVAQSPPGGQNPAAAKGIGSAGLPARSAQSGHASGDLQRKDGELSNADYGRASAARIKSHPNSANNRAGATHGADGGADAAAHAASKHPAGVKYQDRVAAEPAGDQSSSSSAGKFKQDFGQVQANKR